MPLFIDPPPTYIKEFNWHWSQWFNSVFEAQEFRGGLVTTDNTTYGYTSSDLPTDGEFVPIGYDTTIFDTYQMFDRTGGENGEHVLRIPSGVKRIRFGMSSTWDLGSGSETYRAEQALLVNASLEAGDDYWDQSTADPRAGLPNRWQTIAVNDEIFYLSGTSGVVSVEEGDTIHPGMRGDAISGTAFSIATVGDVNGNTFFSWEIIE